MSSVTETARGFGWAPASGLNKIIKSLEGFFRASGVTKQARIWHGGFSYKLIHNTAINSFQNMNPVTSIDAGDCYICVFERPGYQGDYHIISPGEKEQMTSCGSLVVVSDRKFSVDAVRRASAAPPGYWEMDGPMYLMHFSAVYRFVS